MKKLSKKQKLIGFIAIMLAVIIIALVIITSIIKRNNQVKSEGYLATTANASSSLISNYILNGITIGGITGKMEVLDTSDATATPEDIALGKTAYVKGEKITGTRIEPIEELEGNIAYADFEGDGVADGIIFADLAVGNRGDGNWGDSYGGYTIPKETGLKQYQVINESYTEAKFGDLTGKLIAPIEGSSGKDRFYVMALDDIDGNTHNWWANASGKLDSSYNISTSTNDFAVAGAEPTGLVNTRRMMECYANEEINGTEVKQGTNDMWGLIEEEVADGWFVPSKSEWAAFGGEVLELNNITSGNYDDYGLSSCCWSSSQSDTTNAYNAYFYYGYIASNGVNGLDSVRLATTF